MVIFITSDTHFNHGKLVGLRGFNNATHMNEVLIDNWNKTVNQGDTVYHLGDVAMNNKTDFENNILPRLNGNVIFIKGNHDKKSFSRLQNAIIEYKGYTIELVHDPHNALFVGDVVLHGHIHKTPDGGLTREINVPEPEKFYNVNVEFHKLKPKNIDEILGEIKR